MTSEHALGLITGILFGFLLQKGRVLRFEKQVGFLRLMDMTILKFMFSAILVGMVGLVILEPAGLVALKVKETEVGANVLGGLLFGIAWAVVGYCPGTAVGAVGEGRLHAIWAVLGMLAGAMVFAEIYPALSRTVGSWGVYGKLTLPGLLQLPAWVVAAAFVAGVLALFAWFEKKKL